MDRIVKYIKTNGERILISLTLLVFVLLTSCPVKNSLKAFAGQPVNATQAMSGKQHLYAGSNIAPCGVYQSVATSLTQAFSIDLNSLLPVILLTAFWGFLLGISFLKSPLPSFYSIRKLPGATPLFIRQRKLII